MLQSHAHRIIGLDFDEGLFSTNVVWLNELRRHTGHAADYDQILNWNFTPAVPLELNSILLGCRTPQMYRLVRPMPGAVSAVAELAEQGHTLVCVTQDTRPFVQIKAELLRWHFPGVRYMVIAKDKWAAVPGMHALVDDAPHNNPTNIVPQPWNSPKGSASWADRQYAFWRDLPHRFGCC